MNSEDTALVLIFLLEILGLWLLAGVITIAILNDVKRWVANR